MLTSSRPCDWFRVLRFVKAVLESEGAPKRHLHEEARENLLAMPGVGMSILEISHRSKHFEPILAAVERKLSLMIEKPLATELSESEKVLKKIQESGVDAVVQTPAPEAVVRTAPVEAPSTVTSFEPMLR